MNHNTSSRQNSNYLYFSENENSTNQIFYNINILFRYLYPKRNSIIFTALFGGIIGLLIAILTPINYVGKITLVVEDSKISSGGLSSIAGQFGIDIGGATNGGIIGGDNILLYLKSQDLVRQVLLKKYSNTNLTLADLFADVEGFRKDWQKSLNISYDLFRTTNRSRLQDSLLQIIQNEIIKNRIQVLRQDKKSSFIQVEISSKSETFSYHFINTLISTASSNFRGMKTKERLSNISALQKRADSLSRILNSKTFLTAFEQQQLLDANPAIKKNTVKSEITARDKVIATTIFGEVIKNLELSKTLLIQETPLVQVVESSTLPLEIEKRSKKKYLLLGILFSFFLVISIHCFKFFLVQAREVASGNLKNY